MQSVIFRKKEWEPNLQTEDCVLNDGVSEKGGGCHSDKQHHMNSQCNVLEKTK